MEGKGEGAVTLPALLSEESDLQDIQLCGLSTNHLFRITLREIMCCVLNNCLVIHCHNLTTTTTGSFFAFQRGLPAYANAILGNLVWLAISSHLLNFPLLKQCLGCSSNVEHRNLGGGGEWRRAGANIAGGGGCELRFAFFDFSNWALLSGK